MQMRMQNDEFWNLIWEREEEFKMPLMEEEEKEVKVLLRNKKSSDKKIEGDDEDFKEKDIDEKPILNIEDINTKENYDLFISKIDT